MQGKNMEVPVVFIHEEDYRTGYGLIDNLEEYKTNARIDHITGQPTTPIGVHLQMGEPTFTRFLQYCKMRNICNVYTDNIIQFDDIIDGLHFRCECIEYRLDERSIVRYKGQNAL